MNARYTYGLGGDSEPLVLIDRSVESLGGTDNRGHQGVRMPETCCLVQACIRVSKVAQTHQSRDAHEVTTSLLCKTLTQRHQSATPLSFPNPFHSSSSIPEIRALDQPWDPGEYCQK